jgi:hypothetical protein
VHSRLNPSLYWLLVLTLFVLLMLVPPVPIRSLLFALEPREIHVGLMPLFTPAAVGLVFAPIPVVIVVTLAVIVAVLRSLFLFMPLVIVLRSRYGERPNG